VVRCSTIDTFTTQFLSLDGEEWFDYSPGVTCTSNKPDEGVCGGTFSLTLPGLFPSGWFFSMAATHSARDTSERPQAPRPP
jgi:hypothetical protein